jgi:hypothetical protein
MPAAGGGRSFTNGRLRATNVLLPAATVLERIGLAARVRARKKAFQALADGLTDDKRAALDKLLVLDPNVRRSRFAWLRDYAESPAPSNMLGLIDRLDYIRDLGIGSERTGRIHAARLDRLVEEGAIMTVQHIADLEPARRTAVLVAQVANLEIRLTDATLAMFEKYVGSLFTKAQTPPIRNPSSRFYRLPARSLRYRTRRRVQ